MTIDDRDPYHSRVDPVWSFGERHDPVCHGAATGPLSGEELRAYERNGYLVKRALFDVSEVATILREAERLAEVADTTRDDLITEPESEAVRSLFRLHRAEGLFAQLVRDPRLCGVARQVLGSPVYIHQYGPRSQRAAPPQ